MALNMQRIIYKRMGEKGRDLFGNKTKNRCKYLHRLFEETMERYIGRTYLFVYYLIIRVITDNYDESEKEFSSEAFFITQTHRICSYRTMIILPFSSVPHFCQVVFVFFLFLSNEYINLHRLTVKGLAKDLNVLDNAHKSEISR